MDKPAAGKLGRLHDQLANVRGSANQVSSPREASSSPPLADLESLEDDPTENDALLNLREALETLPPPPAVYTSGPVPPENPPPFQVNVPEMPITRELTSRLRNRNPDPEESDVALLADHAPSTSGTGSTDQTTTATSAIDLNRLPLYFAAVRMAPVAFFYGLASGLVGPVFIELLKARVCGMAFQFPDDVCTNLSKPFYQNENHQVTAVASHYSFLSSLVANLPCAIFAIFTGSWSDHFGRKLPMMIPFLGLLASAILLIVFSYVPAHPAFLLFVPLLSAAFGGWIISSAAIYSYIGDYSTPKNLAIDIAVFDGILALASNISSLAGGVLFGLYGFTYPFILYGCLVLLTMLYILLAVRDRRVLAREFHRQGCKGLFSTESVKENVDMLRKERPGRTRFHIGLLLVSVIIAATCSTGNGSINQLFFETSPLSWTLKNYTIFVCVSGVITSLVMIACIPVLKKTLNLKDSTVGIIGVTSTVLSYIILSATEQSWLAVVSATVGTLSGLQYVAARAMLSNWVSGDERGKMMSVIASLQALVPILGAFLFTTIFSASVSWWPGFPFALAGTVMLLALAGYCFIDMQRRGREYNEGAEQTYAKIS